MKDNLELYQAEPAIETKLSNLKQLASDLMKLAKKHGASAAEVGISSYMGLSVSVRLGNVETIEFHRDKEIGLTVYFGQCKGSANSTDINPASLEEMVKTACFIAQHTEADHCAGLVEKEKLAWNYPDLDLYHPWRISPERAVALAEECETAGLNKDPRVKNSEGASVNTQESVSVYANSDGFIGGYPASSHSLQCVLVAEENGHMQRDYEYTVSRVAEELTSARQVGEKAAEKTVSRLNAKRLKTQQVPVIFVPECAKSLFGHFFSAISGGAIYRKSSFLLDQIGQMIFPKHITLAEKPHIKRAVGSAPFDAEGVATQEKNWIQEGILTSYVLNSYSARKLGLKTTGNAGGVFNIHISHADLNFKALLQTMGTGLVVTELMGSGANKLTGDYSRGAAGFWVEKGQILYPVEEITIAGNLKDMYKNMVSIANDVDRRGNIQTGSVLIEKMMVAGS